MVFLNNKFEDRFVAAQKLLQEVQQLAFDEVPPYEKYKQILKDNFARETQQKLMDKPLI